MIYLKNASFIQKLINMITYYKQNKVQKTIILKKNEIHLIKLSFLKRQHTRNGNILNLLNYIYKTTASHSLLKYYL